MGGAWKESKELDVRAQVFQLISIFNWKLDDGSSTPAKSGRRPSWRLLPADEQTHERRFVSPSGDAWLSLYARPPIENIEDHMAAVRRGEHERITYERSGRTWIVVSGYKGDRIFYRKAMLACGGRAWHHLAFEYPSDQKLAFDEFVTRASYALKEYNQIGCPETER